MALIDKQVWLDDFFAKLRKTYGDRLLFFGLQGSYRRGEATESSDFDAIVVLDRLDMPDLDRYRELCDGMPRPEKACGFISGKAELRCWPRHELFQFCRDTEAYHGDLAALVPALTEEDAAEGLRVGASALYHLLAHTYVHGPAENRADVLRGAYKSMFFLLQARQFLRTGEYIDSRARLLDSLAGREKEILRIGNDWDAFAGERRDNPRHFFELLLKWCGDAIQLRC